MTCFVTVAIVSQVYFRLPERVPNNPRVSHKGSLIDMPVLTEEFVGNLLSPVVEPGELKFGTRERSGDSANRETEIRSTAVRDDVFQRFAW